MNVFDLSARLSLDASQYEQGLRSARSGIGRLGQTLKGAAKNAAKIGSIIMGAAGTGVSYIVKKSIEAYKDYEQLVGGVETLFGTGGKNLEEYAAYTGRTVEQAQDDYEALMAAQKIVMYNAEQAYRTAGLDMNSYMETVTMLSASLIQSLDGDTARAAEVADMAIQDMSDNANKMGTSMESIQNAYAGFSKQNFTMLDNLKLGYGGTKTEMERLLQDAEKINKKNGKITKYNINNLSDIIEAIHTVQDEMGITGTTAEEASDTIEGSLKAAKASWQNLLIAFGTGNRDKIKKAMDALVSTGKDAVNNIVPIATNALQSIASFITEVAPIIAENLPGIIEEVLPSLLNAAVTLVTEIAKALPDILEAIWTVLKQFWADFLKWLEENYPEVYASINNVVNWFKTTFENIKEWWESTGKPIFNAVVDFLSEVFAGAETVFTNVKNWFTTTINNIKTWWEETGKPIWDLISTGISTSIEVLESIITSIKSWFETAISSIETWWNETGKPIWDGISSAIVAVWTAIETAWNGAKEFFAGIFEGIENDPTLKTIKNALTKPFNLAVGFIRVLWDGLKTFFSTLWGLITGDVSLGEIFDKITSPFTTAWDTITTAWGGAVEWATKTFTDIKTAITGAFDGIVESVKSVISWVQELLGLGGTTTVSVDTSSPWYGHGGASAKLRHQMAVLHAGAMSGGEILQGMTPFGIDNNGRTHYAGDSGMEAVVGVSSLDKMIQSSVKSAMGDVAARMERVLESVANRKMQLVLDTGALVGETISEYDNALNDEYNWHGGGRA